MASVTARAGLSDACPISYIQYSGVVSAGRAFAYQRRCAAKFTNRHLCSPQSPVLQRNIVRDEISGASMRPQVSLPTRLAKGFGNFTVRNLWYRYSPRPEQGAVAAWRCVKSARKTAKDGDHKQHRR